MTQREQCGECVREYSRVGLAFAQRRQPVQRLRRIKSPVSFQRPPQPAENCRRSNFHKTAATRCQRLLQPLHEHDRRPELRRPVIRSSFVMVERSSIQITNYRNQRFPEFQICNGSHKFALHGVHVP